MRIRRLTDFQSKNGEGEIGRTIAIHLQERKGMHARPILTISASILLLALAGCGPTKAGMQARADARSRIDAISAQFTYEQAKQEFEAGQFERALRDIDLAIEQSPESAQFELLRGRIHLETHRLQNAIDAFMTAIEKDPEYAEAHYFAGIVFQRWSDDEQAFAHYTKACELESDNVQYLVATAEALIALGEFEAARQAIETKLEYFENNCAMKQLLGQIAMLQGHCEVAVKYFSDARLLDPDNYPLLEELAWAQYDAGLYGQCYETVQLIQEQYSSERIDLIHLQARCLVMMDRFAEAHNRYMTLTRLSPADASVWIEFGTLAWELGDMRRVSQCGVRAVALAPDRFEGYMLKGIYERGKGRVDEAVKLLIQAADLAPDSVIPHLLLGRTLEEAGDGQAALIAYANAMRTDPQSEEARSLHRTLQKKLQVASAEQ